MADAPLSLTAVNTPPPTVQGNSTGTFTVATFADANTGAPLSDFTVVVDWGDGSTSTVTSSGGGISGSGGNYAVQAAHIYTSAITTHLSVQVLDEGGSTASRNSANFSIAASQLNLTAVNAVGGATEGIGSGTFTVATFTDVNTSEPASNFTALIQWGDGTTSVVTSANGLSGGNGLFVVQAAHTYAEEISTATVLSVQITDSSGATTSGQSAPFTVADAPLTLTAVNTPTSAGIGVSTGTFTVATFTDANTGAPITDFTAIVNWGDGTTSTITSSNGLIGSGGSYAVQTSHTYAKATTTSIGVQILDVGGSNVSGNSPTFSVPLTPPPPPPPPGPPPPSGGGSSAGPLAVNLVSVTDSYTLFSQVETVSLQVFDAQGNLLSSGLVTVTDGGQTHTVAVTNGSATTTFTFSLLSEQPNSHAISVNNQGFHVSFTAPSSQLGYFFQIFFDLLLFESLTGGGG